MDKAAFISDNGEVLETSMDDIELDIVLDYYKRNNKYMGENKNINGGGSYAWL